MNDDWMVLCMSCHWKYDKPWLNKTWRNEGGFAPNEK